jgi:hypothetical protein
MGKGKEWLSETGQCFLTLVAALFIWAFTVTGPLTLAAATGGKGVVDFYVSVIKAVLSVAITVPLFFLLVFHGLINLVMMWMGKNPTYNSGAYGIVKWMRQYRIYDPCAPIPPFLKPE